MEYLIEKYQQKLKNLHYKFKEISFRQNGIPNISYFPGDCPDIFEESHY